MSKPTELTVHTVRSTKRGSDHYGSCEVCGNECSEHFVATNRRVSVRDDGQHILDGGTSGTYGHMHCLIQRFGNLVAQDSLQRDGNVLLFPQWAVDQIMTKSMGARRAV
ncbi:hypothetical protein RU820_05360 [Acidithiobacillus ferrooxidans]|uniref:Uncharacterized protein n=1 Tax=Acidithiobacillus ferrooxidans (strain ATCC 23270 / DSM 14882 / CIP 104768 / NCIMB 8455) TaxID=243159 RepID=B7J873_ACIF2|nr:hypothetical protein [Acidithiobacillus ferrooxidans]ACK80541.1 hypothetical protein AFE_1125 [Acidithiobacillus ferrooxidans ATCC 23270]